MLRKSLCLFPVAIFAVAISCNCGHAQTVTTYYFDGNGGTSSLIQANDGYLYGTDGEGGSGDGEIYRMGLSGNPEYATFYSFGGNNSGGPGAIVQGTDGALYGCADFPYRLTLGGTFTQYSDLVGYDGQLGCGAFPVPANDGNFYFTGNNPSIPFLLRFNPTEGEVDYLGAPPASSDWGPLQASDGYLYEPVQGGGANGASIVYRVTLSGTFSTFFTFPSGFEPYGPLVEGADSQLYGVGGGSSEEVFYKLNLSTAAYTVVATPPSGTSLPPQVTLASDGNYYGFVGAEFPYVDFVEITPGGTVTVTSLLAPDGPQDPVNPLVQGSDGAFYGVDYIGEDLFKVVLDPPLSAPITMALGSSSITQGGSTTLDWSVSGAYSDTAAYCFASSTDPEWSGLKPVSGQITLTPTEAGTYTYALTCGGTISQFATLTVISNSKVTTTGLVAAPNPVTIGRTETLTATVTPASGAASPAGTVTFKVGSTVLGTSSLSAGANNTAIAVLAASTAGVPAGTYPVVATYNGSTGFAASTSPAVNITVANTVASATTLTAAPSSLAEGGKVTLTATVTGAEGTPAGTVTFSGAGLSLGKITLGSNGAATLATPNTGVPPGTYTVTATYNGSAMYRTSSGTATVTIDWPTTTSVVANPNPVVQGGELTVTATVARTGNSDLPSGDVTFYLNGLKGTNLGNARLSGGTASLTFNTGSVPLGTYPVTAVYGGDVGDDSSTSASYSITVE